LKDGRSAFSISLNPVEAPSIKKGLLLLRTGYLYERRARERERQPTDLLLRLGAMGTEMKVIESIFKRNRKRASSRKITELRDRYPQYEIGRHTYGELAIHTWKEGATLRIGAFCSIGKGTQVFLGGEHRTDWVTTYPFPKRWDCARHIVGHPRTKGNVVIGNDVWIGREAIIMSGVKIGDGAVVGACAVVTKDIEPYAIYAGNPARFVRKRFNEAVIEELLELRWWDFEDAEIEQLLPSLLSSNVDEFILEARRRRRNQL
jgi:chloramphenicol O-acetyltransferase type B